jgi:hypothetical protein
MLQQPLQCEVDAVAAQQQRLARQGLAKAHLCQLHDCGRRRLWRHDVLVLVCPAPQLPARQLLAQPREQAAAIERLLQQLQHARVHTQQVGRRHGAAGAEGGGALREHRGVEAAQPRLLHHRRMQRGSVRRLRPRMGGVGVGWGYGSAAARRPAGTAWCSLQSRHRGQVCTLYAAATRHTYRHCDRLWWRRQLRRVQKHEHIPAGEARVRQRR